MGLNQEIMILSRIVFGSMLLRGSDSLAQMSSAIKSPGHLVTGQS